MVKWILTELFGVESYDTILHEYAAGQGRTLTPGIAALIKRYAPIAVVMNELYHKLRQSKATAYPNTELEHIDARNNIF